MRPSPSGGGLGTNVTPLIRDYITYLSLERDNGWWTVWLGWHAVEKISIAPNGWLIRFRNPEWSARAKASLIEFRPSIHSNAKAWPSEPLCLLNEGER